MLPTAEQLRSLFPRAKEGYISALTNNARLLTEHGLDQPLPLCHFLAQAAAETGDFTIVEESGNYSVQRLREIFPRHFTPGEARAYAHKPQAVLNRAYANRMGNGSEASGDGWRYRGRSILQTTGKDNYRAMANHVGVDLVAQPDLLATDCTLGLKCALIEWSALDLGGVATRLGPTHEAVLAIARGINVGNVNSSVIPNGLAYRKSAFLQVWRALGTNVLALLDPTADGILVEGERGDAVRCLQEHLAALGYAVGAADGVFGPRTRDAVSAYQVRQGFAADGKWRMDYDTRQAIDTAIPHDNAARSGATAADLIAGGDTAVSLLTWIKRIAAGAATFLGLDQAANQSGVQLPETLTGMRQVIDPLASNIAWLAGNRWVLGILAALAVWIAAEWVIRRLVARYRNFQVLT
jgi:putative chitinase